jgi:hypothetical protein
MARSSLRRWNTDVLDRDGRGLATRLGVIAIFQQLPRRGATILAMPQHHKYLRHSPWVLPTVVFLFEFADMQWMFSHEPGLSGHVVLEFQRALLPGTLFLTPIWAILFNCGIAFVIGAFVARLVRISPSKL